MLEMTLSVCTVTQVKSRKIKEKNTTLAAYN